jgi:hypothetical protein
MMQYKVSPTDLVWSPIDGPPIRLWKTNLDSSPNLPIRVPSPILYHPIWGTNALRLVEEFFLISSRPSKYVDLWKVGIV